MASLAPQGEICLIDDPKGGIDVMKIKGKAGALHIEMMFARSMHQTPDMIQQHKLLTEVAGLVDEGLVKTPGSIPQPQETLQLYSVIPRLGLGIHEFRWARPRMWKQTRGWQGQALP